MKKKTTNNPRGAGRKPNTWESSRMVIPDPLKDQVSDLVNKWIKEQKK